MGAAARTARRPIARTRSAARTARGCGWVAAAHARPRIRGVAHVFLRLVGTSRHGVLRLVVRVLAQIGPLIRRFTALPCPLSRALGRLLIAFLRLVRDVVRLLAKLTAQLRTSLRGEQH